MKRTRTTRLLLMGLTPLVLAACEGSQYSTQRHNAGDERLYPNAEACIDSGQHPRADCEAAFATALAEHQATAPRYESAAACTEQHGEGACTAQPTASGQSSFIPFMAGMLMGRAFNTGFSRPAYASRTQPFTAGPGQYWAGGSNPAQRPAQGLPPPPPMARAVTQARGGFGSHYAARGSSGG